MTIHTRTIFASIGAGALLTAASIIGTGAADAHTTDDYASVRQVICTDPGATVDISYTNAYGNNTSRTNVYLINETNSDTRSCVTFDSTTGEYGGYVSTSVYDWTGGYTYCAIYENGTKVAESEDNNSYASGALCY